MEDETRQRILTMLDMVMRPTTSEHERNAALSRLAGVHGQDLVDLLQERPAQKEERLVYDADHALRQLINSHGLPRIRYTLDNIIRETAPERERPWNEWKKKHEETVAECERLRRKVSVLESPRYLRERPVADSDGNIPYPYFLVALLAGRHWQVRFAIVEFCRLSTVRQSEVNHWREQGKAPLFWYERLDDLSLGEGIRSQNIWSDEEIETLKTFYDPRRPVLSDQEIAKEMTKRLGKFYSERAVHTEAYKLDLLKGITRTSRRLKHRPAAQATAPVKSRSRRAADG